jgi:hypothetical protein
MLKEREKDKMIFHVKREEHKLIFHLKKERKIK